MFFLGPRAQGLCGCQPVDALLILPPTSLPPFADTLGCIASPTHPPIMAAPDGQFFVVALCMFPVVDDMDQGVTHTHHSTFLLHSWFLLCRFSGGCEQ